MPDVMPRAAQEAILERMRSFPLHQRLGFELVSAEGGRSVARLRVTPDVLNIGGVLHGGVLYAVMDIAAFSAAITAVPDRTNAATNDIHVSVLRASPPDAVLEITSEVRKVGKRLLFVDAEAHCEGKLVALARVTKSLIPFPPGL